MSPRRFAARRGPADANQAGIALALRRCGASVLDLHALGGGCPDLLVSYRRGDQVVTLLMEVKTAKGTVRDSQEAFAAAWRGCPIVVVRSEAEALTAIGVRLDT